MSTWDQVEPSSESFWRSGLSSTASRPLTLEDMQRWADELVLREPPPPILLWNSATRDVAGRLGQHEYAQHMAALCTASRPIFGDILSPVPDRIRAAHWIVGAGGWPVDPLEIRR
jgi:hypothetical protein